MSMGGSDRRMDKNCIMRGLKICTLLAIVQECQIKEDEMTGACKMHWRYRK
jgi:hypothetical protein